MAMEFHHKIVTLNSVINVEDAEKLLEWIDNRPGVQVDLSGCTHLHPANLQVLLAAKTTVSAWPADVELAQWLQSVMV